MAIELNKIEVDETWDGETDDPKLNQKHEKRIEASDLSYPIFLTIDFMIIDGCHRVCKAKRQGLLNINAIFLTQENLNICKFM